MALKPQASINIAWAMLSALLSLCLVEQISHRLSARICHLALISKRSAPV
jgi:hypothetical protein